MGIYCVYLTTYYGNKMPPFYIGSSSVKKVENGYHGSVASKKYSEIWWSEIKENPHLFKTKIICTFDDRKEATLKEKDLQVKLNVIRSSMYINQATAQPGGYCGRVVSGEDNPFYGKRHTAETRAKLREAKKGDRHPWIGKKRPEHSAALKGRPKPKGFGEKISKANKGKPHGTGKGNRTNFMKANWDKYVTEYVDILSFYFTKPELTIPYNVKSRNGKLIDYEFAFAKEFHKHLGFAFGKVRAIIRGGNPEIYAAAMEIIQNKNAILENK